MQESAQCVQTRRQQSQRRGRTDRHSSARARCSIGERLRRGDEHHVGSNGLPRAASRIAGVKRTIRARESGATRAALIGCRGSRPTPYVGPCASVGVDATLVSCNSPAARCNSRCGTSASRCASPAPTPSRRRNSRDCSARVARSVINGSARLCAITLLNKPSAAGLPSKPTLNWLRQIRRTR
jgi:hypothetical protein